MAQAGVTTVSGQVQGILDVLVLGAGTDYALLMASRYREELRRTEDKYQAMGGVAGLGRADRGQRRHRHPSRALLTVPACRRPAAWA
jgi:hypothetical protein